METSRVEAAVNAAKATAAALGLRVDDVAVLWASNRVTLRLLPCDVLVRVAPPALHAAAAFEVEVARQLAATGSPVARLDPRVEPRPYVRDGFAISFWTYHEPVPPEDVEPAEFADALQRLHAGLRQCDFAAPHFLDRIVERQQLVADRTATPDLRDSDRALLHSALQETIAVVRERGAAEQLLHGEPHPGNVLRTRHGVLFTDLETCRRGPVEFDIAWYARPGPGAWQIDAALPDQVGQLYPGADRKLIRACWVMILAMVAAYRWDRDDRFPDRDAMREEWLGLVRAAVDRYGLDASR